MVLVLPGLLWPVPLNRLPLSHRLLTNESPMVASDLHVLRLFGGPVGIGKTDSPGDGVQISGEMLQAATLHHLTPYYRSAIFTGCLMYGLSPTRMAPWVSCSPSQSWSLLAQSRHPNLLTQGGTGWDDGSTGCHTSSGSPQSVLPTSSFQAKTSRAITLVLISGQYLRRSAWQRV